jgi:hypothetical protein
MTGRPLKRQRLGASAIAAGAAAASADRAPGEERDRMIAVAAYCRAERRRFAPGRELEDWLAAEAEFEARLCKP